MAVSLEDKLAQLPSDRRAKIDARAAELIAEEMTLRDPDRPRAPDPQCCGARTQPS